MPQCGRCDWTPPRPVGQRQAIFNGSPENLARTRVNVTRMGGAVKAAEAGVEMTMLKLPKAPPEQMVGLRPQALRAGQDDLATMAQLPAQIAALGGLGSLEDLPLVVISRGKPDRGMSEAMNVGWLAAHRRLAALSTRATLISASDSGHLVNLIGLEHRSRGGVFLSRRTP